MAYDPVAQSGSWHPVGTQQTDEQGRPYMNDSRGKRVYLSPAAIDGYTTDKGPYQSGLLGGGSQWNTETGQWDKKSNTLEKLTLAGAAAPFAAFGIGALAGGSGGAAASGGSTLLGEGGTASGLSTAGATPGLIGGSATAGGGMGGGGVLGGLMNAGKIASGVSQGRANGRQAEAQTNVTYDLARQRGERQGVRQLLSADLLGSMKPPTDARAQPYLSNTSISPEALAMLKRKGQQNVNGGGLTPLPQSGKTDTLLNTLGLAGQFSGALGGNVMSRIPGIGRFF